MPGNMAACTGEIWQLGAADAAHAGPKCRAYLATEPALPPLGSRTANTPLPSNEAALFDVAAALSEPAPAPLPDNVASKAHRPDPALIPAVMAQLPKDDSEDASWVGRLLKWIRGILFPPTDQVRPPELPAWLNGLLGLFRGVSTSSWTAIAWTCCGLLFCFLIWIAVREYRATRGLRRGPRGERSGNGQAAALPIDEIGALPPAERPAALLRWVVADLMRRQLLPSDQALTNRELGVLLPAVLRAPFAGLADAAERALYGDLALPADELQRAHELARRLASPGEAAAA
jgi:hypothetical protein